MHFTFNTILLGAALAAASPIAYNTPSSQRSTKSFPANSTSAVNSTNSAIWSTNVTTPTNATTLTIATTPTNNTQTHDFATELNKCNWEGFEECKSKGRKDCGEELINTGTCTVEDILEHFFGPGAELWEDSEGTIFVCGDCELLGSNEELGDSTAVHQDAKIQLVGDDKKYGDATIVFGDGEVLDGDKKLGNATAVHEDAKIQLVGDDKKYGDARIVYGDGNVLDGDKGLGDA